MVSYIWIVILLALVAVSTGASLYLFFATKAELTKLRRESDEAFAKLEARLEALSMSGRSRQDGPARTLPLEHALRAAPADTPASGPRTQPSESGVQSPPPRNSGEMRLLLKVQELRNRPNAG